MLNNFGKFWEYGGGRMTLAAICAQSLSISIGFTQGYSAILLPQLETEDLEQFKNLTDDEKSWIASLGAVTNPVGSILSGLLADYMGRRRAIQITILPFVLGWVCLGLAQNVNWLYAGRLITGIAGGMATASYTYVGEIATAEKRGILLSLGPINASFGILLTYVLGSYLHWSIVAYICIIFIIITAIAMQCLPESPGYLLRNNRFEEGFETLLWFRRNNALAQQELDRFNDNQKVNSSEGKSIYLSPQTIKPFIYLVLLFLMQEFSGIYTLLYYAVDFFKQADVDVNKYVASMIVGAIRFAMSIIAAFLINRFGRKVLCTYSSLGMAATMLIVAIYSKYYEINSDETRVAACIPLIGVIFNVIFCMIGMLPIPWIMNGEMFPLEVRSVMSGVVLFLAQTFIFICVKIYSIMNNSIQFSGTLFTFVAASIVSTLYCKFLLPETRNKSLEEIEEYFRSGKKQKKIDNVDVEGVDNRAYQNDDAVGSKTSGEIVTVIVNDNNNK